MENIIDLHSHTTASDGELTPEELIELAMSKNIKTLAITDHDTVDGLERATKYSENKEILIIPGIELEADVNKGQMHILGLFIDYYNEELIKELNNIRRVRNERNDKFIQEFNHRGFPITIEELKEISKGNTIGKPHFAKVFLKKGYIQTKSEMFDRFFNQPPLNKLKKSSHTPAQIITMIKKANGMAVLAHPQSLKLGEEELIKKIEELKSYGLDGLECYHSKQTPEEMELFVKIARKLNLVITKGSDYHGPIIKPEIQLGTGNNNNIVLGENREEEIIKNVIEYAKKNKLYK